MPRRRLSITASLSVVVLALMVRENGGDAVGTAQQNHDTPAWITWGRAETEERDLDGDDSDDDDDDHEGEVPTAAPTEMPIDVDQYTDDDDDDGDEGEIPAEVYCECAPMRCPYVDGYKKLNRIFTNDKPYTLISCSDKTYGNTTSKGFSIPDIPEHSKLKYSLESLSLNLHFTGSIPESLYSLTALSNLELAGSNSLLGGSVSERLGKLTNLKSLELGSQISGSIPSSISALKYLRKLKVYGNLNGNFQPEVFRLTNLRALHLKGNFVGQLSDRVGALYRLEELTIDSFDAVRAVDIRAKTSGLTGTIPKALYNLPRLKSLSFLSQNFTGTIDRNLGFLSNLNVLNLHDNSLTGPVLPECFEKLTKLTALDLEGNLFSGSVPSRIGKLSALEYLGLGSDNFSPATMPKEISLLTNLKSLIYSHAHVKGTIPIDIGKLSNLVTLDLGENNLSGQIPPLPTSLKSLHLQENLFTSFAEPLKVSQATIRLDQNQLVCNCSLTSWFGDLLQNGNVLEFEENVLCSDTNSFGGMPVSLIRYSLSAPCSHPQGIKVYDTSKLGIHVGWKMEAPIDMSTQLLLDRSIAFTTTRSLLDLAVENNTKACWDCSTLLVDGKEKQLDSPVYSTAGVAFQISYTNGKDLSTVHKCCSVSKFVNVQSDSVNFPLTALQPFTKYEITIRTIHVRFDIVNHGVRSSRFSFGPSSAPFVVETDEDVPTNSPDNYGTSSLQDDEFFLEWSTPTELNGLLVRYEVRYKEAPISSVKDLNGRTLEESQVLIDPTEHSIFTTTNFARFKNLRPGTFYVIRTRAFTKVGPGPFSEPYTVRTRESCPSGFEKLFKEEIMSCTPCALGFYREDNDASCVNCPDMFPVTLSTGSNESTLCTTGRGSFKDFTTSSSPVARQCWEGMICSSPGLTSLSLPLEIGYWRESNRSLDIMKCKDPNYCQQSSTEGLGLCTTHHTGVQCLACDKGFAIKSLSGTCEFCTEEDRQSDTRAFIGWVVLLSIVAMGAMLRIYHVARRVRFNVRLMADVYSAASRIRHIGKLKTESPSSPRAGEEGFGSFSFPMSESESSKVCYCSHCGEALLIDGFRAVDRTGSETFFHSDCLKESLESEALSETTIQLVKVEGAKDNQVSQKVSSEEERVKSENVTTGAATERKRVTWNAWLNQKLERLYVGLDSVFWVKFRIFLGFLQVYVAFLNTFHSNVMELGPVLTGIFALVDFDISVLLNLFTVRCAWDHHHYDSLLLYTISPLVFVILLLLMYKLISCLFREIKQAVLRARTEALTMILFLFFMIYPGISMKIFETFICDTYPTADGENVPVHALAADPRLSCDSEERSSWIAYTIVMVLLYPVGILLAYVFLLFSIHTERWKLVDERSAEENHRVDRVSFLYRPYTREAYWYEAYELLRKMSQTTIVLFIIGTSSSTQMGIFICQLLTGFAIAFLLKMDPYRRKTDFHLAIISQAVLFNACVCSLIASFSETNDQFGVNKDALQSWVTAAFIFELLAFVGFTLYDGILFFKSPRKFHAKARQGVAHHLALADDGRSFAPSYPSTAAFDDDVSREDRSESFDRLHQNHNHALDLA